MQVTEAHISTKYNKTEDINVTSLVTQEFGCIKPTNSSNMPQLGSHTKINLTIAINASPNIISNNAVQDCVDNAVIITDENAETVKKNEIKANDTVLKYVYKKNDHISLLEKTQGHPKNSLKRRKRSYNIHNSTEDIKAHESQNAPLIVNYETSHDTQNIYTAEPLENPQTGNVIKSSNLADFNIETLHENVATPLINSDIHSKNPESELIKNNNIPLKQKNNDESVENNSNDNKEELDESNESSETDRYISLDGSPRSNKAFKINKKSPESEEEEDYKNRRYRKKDTSEEESKPYIEENESNEKQYYKESSDKNDNRDQTSYESDENITSQNNQSTESQESNETEEKSNPNINTKSRLKNESDENASYKSYEKESNERKDTDYLKKDNDRPSHRNKENIKDFENSSEKNVNINRYTDETSVENSDESNESKQKFKEPLRNYESENKSIPPIIQDVDLGDFSYERIQLNDKGQVELSKDNAGHSDDNNISKELTYPSTSKSEKKNNEKYSLSKDKGTSSESTEDKQPIHINDGEIKPVVEITGENNSESSENIKESEDKSLETFLGIKKNIDNSQKEKIVVNNEKEIENGDVKQQFERIPLNYKHDEKNIPENNNNEEIIQNEGTLDTLSPTDPQYDKHLKFKFDDITIKLPEIKLPEDILDYAYDNSPYDKGLKTTKKNKKSNKNTKPRFYNYDDDYNKDESESQKHRKQDEDDYGYYGYYDNPKEKDNYKNEKDQQEDENDDYVDLYEKFVRERFGKKGSFEQRSEKLRDATQIPENNKLYQTIHEVLKKTQDVQKQAEQSGDPNAGYMWTLEYGQNL
ncbi:GATA zinc finger domain-containing protein 14-like [Galleria mellonella]|uniref:GATA zinc finger domain-containing protein 14-like n=1 Tax=Galleria mellonella TaxID=7137 RepID=A0ABM3MAP2_GALME|nr:GATA zinc finger domain-containing protein 14-like [Galleria mellonella]